MYWINIKRIAKAGFVNFWRNGFVSLASILVMLIALFVIGSLVFSNSLLQSSMQELKSKVDINAYFATDAKEQDTLSVKKSLESLPEVSSVEYISSDQTLANFKQKHENDPTTLQALDELGSNPFGASLSIKAKDPSQYEAIDSFLKSNSLLSKDSTNSIDDNYQKNAVAIKRLSQIIQDSEKSNTVRTIILALVAFLVSFNTIRLAIYISRDEISVMKLVGASNKYIRGPFIIVGVMYGFIAALVTIALFYPVTYWFGPLFYPLPLYFGDTAGKYLLFDYYIKNLGQISLVVILSGIIIGALSSYMAVKRYLRV